MRRTCGRPAPRAKRAFAPSLKRPQPVFPAIRPAICRPSSVKAGPARSNVVFLPLLSISAAPLTALSLTLARVDVGRAVTTFSAGPQAVSAGRIKVAICPGACVAASIAAAPSAATSRELSDVRTQWDMGRATPSISEVSGASCLMWYVVCSPTTLTTPEFAFFALCRLASPFARPGPRCSNVDAGLPAIR